jgi:hypothetical protein
MYEALVERQMRSLDRPHVYTEVSNNRLQMQSLSRTCSRRHLKSNQGLSNLNQLNAVSAFKSGQSELSTGPTFYPNRTTERLAAARRRRPTRQSSSDS